MTRSRSNVGGGCGNSYRHGGYRIGRRNKEESRDGVLLLICIALLLATILMLAAGQAASEESEQKIGQVLHPDYLGAEGQRVSGVTEDLMPQTFIYTDERVVTPSDGGTQLEFEDQSTLRIGPASEVVLDDYVYDPASGEGSAAILVTNGIMRFISGDIETEEEIDLQTPHATITIRGTDVIIKVTD